MHGRGSRNCNEEIKFRNQFVFVYATTRSTRYVCAENSFIRSMFIFLFVLCKHRNSIPFAYVKHSAHKSTRQNKCRKHKWIFFPQKNGFSKSTFSIGQFQCIVTIHTLNRVPFTPSCNAIPCLFPVVLLMDTGCRMKNIIYLREFVELDFLFISNLISDKFLLLLIVVVGSFL